VDLKLGVGLLGALVGIALTPPTGWIGLLIAVAGVAGVWWAALDSADLRSELTVLRARREAVRREILALEGLLDIPDLPA
jgi:hypothetical protein